jgi:hypothetical protein
MVYFLIRHKATGEYMPLAKRKGYTHWNPGIPGKVFGASMGVPRLIDTRRKAARIIVMWASQPNLSYHHTDNIWESHDLQIKEDGRKKEDLEIVEVCIMEVGIDWGKDASFTSEGVKI